MQRTLFFPGPSQALVWTVIVVGDSAVFSKDGSGGYPVEGDGVLTKTSGNFVYSA